MSQFLSVSCLIEIPLLLNCPLLPFRQNAQIRISFFTRSILCVLNCFLCVIDVQFFVRLLVRCNLRFSVTTVSVECRILSISFSVFAIFSVHIGSCSYCKIRRLVIPQRDISLFLLFITAFVWWNILPALDGFNCSMFGNTVGLWFDSCGF